MRKKLDKVKLRARLHWAEAGPLHFGYCSIIALTEWEAHLLLSLFAGGMGLCIILVMFLNGGGAE